MTTTTAMRASPATESLAGRLPSLTGLRIVAAFAVFGFHLRGQHIFADQQAEQVVELIFGQAVTAVGFFFIMSGFVLTCAARPGTPARAAWLRRAAKIFPVHIVTWFIALVGIVFVAARGVPGFTAVANLLLLQAWVPDDAVFFALNTPAWFLSCELAFVVAFPLLLRWIGRVRDRMLWPLATVVVTVILLVPVAALPLDPGLAHWVINIFPPTRALEFVLGMVLARIVLAGRWIGVGHLGATALFLVGYVLSGFVPDQFSYIAGTFIPLALLIPAVAVADMTGARSPWRNAILVKLGKLALAFYLVHQLVIRAVSSMFGGRQWDTLAGIGIAAAMLAMSICAAWLLYRAVEMPMARLIAGPQRLRPAPPPEAGGR